jgi:hypothetical protein
MAHPNRAPQRVQVLGGVSADLAVREVLVAFMV